MMLSLIARGIAVTTGREYSGVESALRGMLMFPGTGARAGRGVEIVGKQNVHLGKHVVLYGSTYLNALGPHGRISIGDESRIDRNCVLYGQGGLTIGSRCAIAAGVLIYSQSNQCADGVAVLAQPVTYAPVEIQDDVWIGAGAVVLPGVSIGRHAVVAAGAVVRKDVPAGTIVAGVPARSTRIREFG
jgi:acetyltransferase-like isoleucine patch superfamily enzyme